MCTRAGNPLDLAGLALVACGIFAQACSKPPDLPWSSATLRGHQDLVLTDGGGVEALFASNEGTIGVCLRAHPTVDTSQWRAHLQFDGPEPESATVEASVRLASTVCFERPLQGLSAGQEARLRGRIEDAFDGRSWELDGLPFRILEDASTLSEQRSRLRDLLRLSDDEKLDAFVGDLRRLEIGVRDLGFPALSFRMRLIRAHYLRSRGGDVGKSAARQLMETVPDWLRQPAAAAWAALAEQERHELERAAAIPSWSRMRLHLQAARDHYLRIADPKTFTVAMQEANLLSRAGATTNAIATLRAALGDCDGGRCPKDLLRAGRGNLAWLLLSDPLADAEHLEEAESILKSLLDSDEAKERVLTRANRLLNLAYLENRRGGDATALLAEARRLLEDAPQTQRGETLALWADLLLADSEIARHDSRLTSQASRRCQAVVEDATTPRLAAWAAGCVAAARRQEGRLQAADSAFAKALDLHERTVPQGLDELFSLAPGRRADDFYGAARLAVELGDPERAWHLLERLDGLSALTPGGCSESSDKRRGEAQRRAALRLELAELDRPASVQRERQVESLRRLLEAELAELTRREAACAVQGRASDGSGLRAFPTTDEILVLRRSLDGQIVLHRRASMDRRALIAFVARAGGEEKSDFADDALAVELTTILGPAATDGTVGYWLHGALQALPLNALFAERSDGRFVAVRWPAMVGGGEAQAHEVAEEARRMFVVDPIENLPSGRRLASLYQRLFPNALVLRGKEATKDAVLEAMVQTDWLHFDTHGLYDEAFPELTRLVLADGELRGGELVELSATLSGVNLLGCWTGAWPISADSGRYGLAGAFARAGAPWTIASREALPDAMARDFNEVFYRRLAAGSEVSNAFAVALAALSDAWPARRWGSILLLRGASIAGSEEFAAQVGKSGESSLPE